MPVPVAGATARAAPRPGAGRAPLRPPRGPIRARRAGSRARPRAARARCPCRGRAPARSPRRARGSGRGGGRGQRRSRRPRPGAPPRTGASSRAAGSGRARRAPRRATSDLSTSRACAPSTASSPTIPPAQTARAASSVNPPANAARRRNTARVASSSRSWLQSIEAASVCWRAATPRGPRTSSAKRSSRPASISRGVSVRSHAAASSSASGMPSRRAHIVRIASSLEASSVNHGRTWAAALEEQRERLVALERAAMRHTVSPGTPSGSRLVASTVTSGQPRSRAPATSATASSRCSQLSRHSSSCRSRRLDGERPQRALDRLDEHAQRRGDQLGDERRIRHARRARPTTPRRASGRPARRRPAPRAASCRCRPRRCRVTSRSPASRCSDRGELGLRARRSS